MMTTYLLLNLSIAVAFGVWVAVELFVNYFLPTMSFRTRVKSAEALFAVALIAPVAVSFLPTEAVQPFSFRVLAPLAEASQELGLGSIVKEAVAPPLPPVEKGAVVLLPWRDMLPMAFALGLLVSLAIKLSGAVQLRRILREAALIRQVGKLKIAASPRVGVPLSTLLGGHAWILVPESMIANWKDFRLALKHEAQHHRQRDTLWALFIELCMPLFFVNPFIYLWKSRMSEIQELSCDEALIGHKVSSYDYASCLVRVAEAALKNRERLVGTASMAAGFENPVYLKSFLKRRIEMLTQHRCQRPCRLAGIVMGTAGVFIVSALVFSAHFAFAATDRNRTAAGKVETVPGVQKIAEAALDSAVKRHKASLGFIVVSDVETGQVLAVANQDVVSPDARRTPHWALSLRVEPASISKVIVAAMAIDKGATSPNEMHNCEMGKYEVGGRLIQDWKPFDHLSTTDTVAQSSNICGIKVGEKLGLNNVLGAFKTFGFGAGGSAENFPEARSGVIPEKVSGSPEAQTLQNAILSTGYSGISTSPIEMVQAIGAIANGGNLLKPQSGIKIRPKVVRRVISTETAAKMKGIMEAVLETGTAKNSKSKLYRLAGKTATGYSSTHGEHDTLGGESNMASFVGFGPVEKPRIVVYVAIENPNDGKGVHGAYHAAPIFREVAEKTLKHLNVPSL